MATYDLTQRHWGHDIEVLWAPSEGAQRVCVSLSAKIQKGDTIEVRGSRSTGTYKVVSDVETPVDPGDQHFMTVRRVA